MDTIEKREYREASDKMFIKSAPDVDPYVRDMATQDLHGAWSRLVAAGYTPNDAWEPVESGEVPDTYTEHGK